MTAQQQRSTRSRSPWTLVRAIITGTILFLAPFPLFHVAHVLVFDSLKPDASGTQDAVCFFSLVRTYSDDLGFVIAIAFITWLLIASIHPFYNWVAAPLLSMRQRSKRFACWMLFSVGLVAIVFYLESISPWSPKELERIAFCSLALSVGALLVWILVQATSKRFDWTSPVGWIAAIVATCCGVTAIFTVAANRPAYPLKMPFLSLYMGLMLAWLIALLPFAIWQKFEYRKRLNILQRYYQMFKAHVKLSAVNATLLGVGVFVLFGLQALVLLLIKDDETGRASYVKAVGDFSPTIMVVLFSLFLQQSVQAFVLFVTRHEDLASATTQLLIERAVRGLSGHYIVGGYGRLGTTTVRGLVAHHRSREEWNRTKYLPLLSEEWLAWHGPDFSGSCRRLPFYDQLVVVDVDETRFLHVFQTRSGFKLGLALIRYDDRRSVLEREKAEEDAEKAPGSEKNQWADQLDESKREPGWAVAPAVVGGLNTFTVQEACRFYEAAIVVSTMTEPVPARSLLRNYQNRSRDSEPGPVLIVALDREMEKSYSQEMTFQSSCSLIFPGHRIASAFAHKLYFFSNQPGGNQHVMLIGRRKYMLRSLAVYWALNDRRDGPETDPETVKRDLEVGLKIITDEQGWAIESGGPRLDVERGAGGEPDALPLVPENVPALSERQEAHDARGPDDGNARWMDPVKSTYIEVARRGERQSEADTIMIPALVGELSLLRIEREMMKRRPHVIGVFLPDDSALARDIVHDVAVSVRRIQKACRERGDEFPKPYLVVTGSNPEKKDIKRAMVEFDQFVEPRTQNFGIPEGLVDMDEEVWRVVDGIVSSVHR